MRRTYTLNPTTSGPPARGIAGGQQCRMPVHGLLIHTQSGPNNICSRPAPVLHACARAAVHTQSRLNYVRRPSGPNKFLRQGWKPRPAWSRPCAARSSCWVPRRLPRRHPRRALGPCLPAHGSSIAEIAPRLPRHACCADGTCLLYAATDAVEQGEVAARRAHGCSTLWLHHPLHAHD